MHKALFYALYFINLSIIIAFWWSNSGAQLGQSTPVTLIALGRLAGLLSVICVLMQFVLIGRAIWIERTFGLDRLSRVHRLNGHLTIVLLLLHFLLITTGYALVSNVSFITQIINFFNYQDVPLAIIALVLFLIIVGFSIYIVRRKLKYETWYSVHLLTYLAVVLAWGHQLKNGEDFLANQLFVYYWYGLYIFVLSNFIIFRFFKPAIQSVRHQFQVEKVIPETRDTSSIYISGKAMNKFKINAGQFMIVRFLSKQFQFQAHPFSLSQAPNGKNLRLTIKNVGDYTSQIAQVLPGTPVLIDGPFGVFTAESSKKDKILFVAGGIGITPIRSMIEELAPQGKDLMLLYGNKTADDIVFKNELEALSKQYNFPIHHILSQSNDPQYLTGYINKELLQKLVPDILERDIFFCGPPIMMEKLIADLHALNVKPANMHYEKFSL